LGFSPVMPPAMPALRAAPFVPLAPVATATPPPAATRPSSAAVVRGPRAKRPRLAADSPADPDAAARASVLGSWVSVLRRLGRDQFDFAPSTDFDGEELLDDVAAVLFGKATSTLQKRIQSLESFLWWCEPAGCAQNLSLATCKRYLVELRDSGAAPSKAQSFREALAFAHGHFGLTGGDALVSDRVLRGLAWQSLARRSDRRQAAPMPVDLVRALEEFVCDNKPEPEVVIAGAILYCLHARMRFGDLVRMDREPVLDLFEGTGFLQGAVLYHKIAGPTPSLPLPVVALADGVTGKPWAKCWLAARLACGISACRRTGLVPMVGIGGWIDRRMRTTEVGCWIREFAKSLANLPDEQTAPLGASGLKPTLLSWAAKFGMETGSRRLFGYHVKPKDKSVLIYSRDALAKPLRDLGKVLSAIRDGAFLPDADRSGRFREGPVGAALPSEASAPLPEVVEAIEVPDSFDWVPSSSAAPPPPPGAPSEDDGTSSSSSSSVSSTASPTHFSVEVLYVVNKRAKIVHVESTDGLLTCGRPYPRAFAVSRNMPDGVVACRRCFKCQS